MNDLDNDTIEQFKRWQDRKLSSKITEENKWTLQTFWNWLKALPWDNEKS
jgi:hypothetical protein